MGSTETAIDAESNTKSIRTDDNESNQNEEDEPMSPKFDITVKSENLIKTPDNNKSCQDLERIDSKVTQPTTSSPFKLAQQPSQTQNQLTQLNQQNNQQQMTMLNQQAMFAQMGQMGQI